MELRRFKFLCWCYVNDEMLYYAEHEGAKGRKRETASLCFLSRYFIVDTTLYYLRMP